MKAGMCIVVTLVIPAPAAGDDVVLREDFQHVADGKLPAHWSSDDPGWSVQKGCLRGAAPQGETTILFGSAEWRDVALAADVWFAEAEEDKRWAALLLREGGPDAPGIQFTARREATRGNGLELAARRRKQARGDWRLFQGAAAQQWHRKSLAVFEKLGNEHGAAESPPGRCGGAARPECIEHCTRCPPPSTADDSAHERQAGQPERHSSRARTPATHSVIRQSPRPNPAPPVAKYGWLPSLPRERPSAWFAGSMR